MPQLNDITEDELAQILARRKQQEAAPPAPQRATGDDPSAAQTGQYLSLDQVDNLILADAILLTIEHLPPGSLLVERLHQARNKLLAYAGMLVSEPETAAGEDDPDTDPETGEDEDEPAMQIG